MGHHQFSLLFGVVLTTLFLMFVNITDTSLPDVPHVALGAFYDQFNDGTVLFVGDVMLGRAVERRTDTLGTSYPFEGVRRLVEGADVAVLNFEGTVPEVHHATADGSLTFSIKQEFLSELKNVGFDVLGLANNHAYDYGADGFIHTNAVCEQESLICVGDPREVGTSSSAVVEVGSTRVGILAIHGTTGLPDLIDVAPMLTELYANSDIQVVFIHWGNEYEQMHSDEQETFAHALIDSGVDAVIGHHPHVVQDIEVYNGRPIFYSLGNFIFDQFLNDKTEQGLTVRMNIGRDNISYTLVPVSSIDTPSQPHLMDVSERDSFLDELMQRSQGAAKHRLGTTLGPFTR